MSDWTKPERFAVVRKPTLKRRYYANFRELYETKEEAFAEACRLSKEHTHQFFVVELVAKTSKTIKVKPEEARI